MIYISDLHLSDKQPISRMDSVFDAGISKLEYVLKRAKELNTFVVCGGDFFHEPRVSYRVLNSVMDVIKKYGVTIYTVFGNHDIIGVNDTDESAAIFTLLKSGLIQKLDFIDGEDYIIESVDYNKSIPTAYFFKHKQTKKQKILVVHNALVPTKACFDHVLLKEFKTDANIVLCGHIHQFWNKKIGDTTFISPSCLVRRSVSEKDQNPCFIILDGKNVTVERIPVINTAEFCVTTSEEVTNALSTAINDTKVEASNIEDYINSSAYDKRVKEFCINKINKVRLENAD